MEQVTEELAHSLEELANGVAAHAERRIQLVGVRGKDDLFVAAGGALAFGVDAGSMLLHNFVAVFADDLMSAIAIIDILPVVVHVVASRLFCAALDALAINVGAGNILAHNCFAVIAQNIVGAIVVGNKLEVLTHVVALMTAASAGGLALIVDVSGGIDDSITCIADVRAGTIAVVDRVLIAVVARGIRSVTFRALTIHKRAGHLLFQVAIVADCLVSGAVVVAHIGHVFVETRGGRKGCRSHSKHHSTCYNKRQHTAYFFEFHKPNLLYYKNNTVYFSINAVLCCATMHGRQSTLFPETT